MTILEQEIVYRVRFNDSWCIFHNSSWSFHEPYFRKRHIFHESYRVSEHNTRLWSENREESTKLFHIDIISKHSYRRFPPSPISLSSKSFLDIFFGAEITNWKDETINFSNIYYLIYCFAEKHLSTCSTKKFNLSCSIAVYHFEKL